MQGWRKNMEDAHICMTNIAEDISLFGVFDGHGGKFWDDWEILGQDVAIFAKKNLPILLKGLPSFKSKNYKQALIDAFMGLDKRLDTQEGKSEIKQIHEESKNSPVFEQQDCNELANNMGCTACVALITKTEIYVANAGDSRCVLSKNGVAVNLSDDHKPDLELEKKRIEKAEGFVEDNRVNGVLSLSRSLGDLDYKRNAKLPQEEQMITAFPEIRIEKITNEHDFLVIACDGVWDCMTSQQVVDYMKEHLSKKQEKGFKISKVIESMLDKILPAEIGAQGNSAYSHNFNYY